MEKFKNVAKEDVEPVENEKDLKNVQEKMLQISVNMEKLKNVAMENVELAMRKKS